MEKQKLQKTASQSSNSQSSVSTDKCILRRRPTGSSEEFKEIWRIEFDRSPEDRNIREIRETYIDNEETRLFRKNIGLGQNRTNDKSVKSTTTLSLIETPLANPNESRVLWKGETDRSKEDGRILESRETYVDEPHVRNFREGIGAPPKTPNNPIPTTGLIEYEEEEGSASIREIREEDLETTELTENLSRGRTTGNYPSLFTIGLSLLILGGFVLVLFWFASWTNKNQVYKFQRNIRQNHYSKTATK